jgi:hypothetical protein
MASTDSSAIELIKLGGGIAGVIALLWRVLETIGAYIQIRLEVQRDDGSTRIKIETAIENKLYFGKKLEAAFLLIGPEVEEPGQIARALGKLYPPIADLSSMNEMVSKIGRTICRDNNRAPSGIFDDGGRAIVPLTYYYLENISVGDEQLTYSCTIDQSKFPPGVYSVRFYVEPKWSWRYFRSVQTVFEVPPKIRGRVLARPSAF